MPYTDNWAEDWHCIEGDQALSRKLLPIFDSYLAALERKGVAKSTSIRHRNSRHAHGNYIVGQVYQYQWDSFASDATGEEILLHFLDGHDGPLIFQDEESLQRQVDTTCRKLYKFLKGKIT